jgi:hypothetical protein
VIFTPSILAWMDGTGWGIPIAPPTLMITVGGIATKPRYVNGSLQPQEMLDVTTSVDHDLVDGAPAAHGSHADLLILSKVGTASDLYVIRALRPRHDAAQHPTLHQKGANQPECVRQRAGQPGTRLTAVPVQ